ncbi:MAG: hypothetical protein RIQ81_2385 [Pseudomonadota bacterium]|jgi:hypothetical protein
MILRIFTIFASALIGLSACAPSKFKGGGGVRPAKNFTGNNQPGTGNQLPEPPVPSTPPLQKGGVAFTRLGINMEDLGYGGDRDFNDTVYCFTFKGTLVGTSIQASESQTIQIRRTNNSKQNHDMEVQVLDANRAVKTTHGDYSASKTNTSFSIQVEAGDFIHAIWKLSNGTQRAIDDPVADPSRGPETFKVLPNQCNT